MTVKTVSLKSTFQRRQARAAEAVLFAKTWNRLIFVLWTTSRQLGGLLWRLHDRRPIVEKACIGAETVTGFWAIFFVS